MGMRPMQILPGVELPNALFVTFAGIRTALAINVGTAPLAFLIGGGGLGELIFTGHRSERAGDDARRRDSDGAAGGRSSISPSASS